jgi:hypothetical protein
MLMVRSATGLSWERGLQELPAAMSSSRVRTYSLRWDRGRVVTSVVVIQFLCEALGRVSPRTPAVRYSVARPPRRESDSCQILLERWPIMLSSPLARCTCISSLSFGKHNRSYRKQVIQEGNSLAFRSWSEERPELSEGV